MDRRPDWAAALHSYLFAQRGASFSYNGDEGLDCCTFTFGAIEAQTGKDIYPFLYKSYRESLRVMRDYCGGASLEPAIEKLFTEHGLEECPVAMARRGDPILIRQGKRGSSLGLIDLNGRDIITISNEGIIRLPRSRGFRAWHIK